MRAAAKPIRAVETNVPLNEAANTNPMMKKGVSFGLFIRMNNIANPTAGSILPAVSTNR